MGRWGKGIYNSDSALDYQSTITDRLEREIAYRLTPEEVDSSGWWLTEVLSVIQTILLFEEGEIGSSVWLQHESAVRRWREVFLSVWDEDWKDESLDRPYNNPEYRKQHRPVIMAMFTSLESIAHAWETLDHFNTRVEPIPMPPEYPLPYFSVQGARFLWDLMELLEKDITYRLSIEKRSYALAFYIVQEEVPVAVDILTVLADKYQMTPGITEQAVRKWHDTAIEIIKQTMEDYDLKADTDRFKDFHATFDKLKAAAQKYPPNHWWASD